MLLSCKAGLLLTLTPAGTLPELLLALLRGRDLAGLLLTLLRRTSGGTTGLLVLRIGLGLVLLLIGLALTLRGGLLLMLLLIGLLLLLTPLCGLLLMLLPELLLILLTGLLLKSTLRDMWPGLLLGLQGGLPLIDLLAIASGLLLRLLGLMLILLLIDFIGLMEWLLDVICLPTAGRKLAIWSDFTSVLPLLRSSPFSLETLPTSTEGFRKESSSVGSVVIIFFSKISWACFSAKL